MNRIIETILSIVLFPLGMVAWIRWMRHERNKMLKGVDNA